jgi:hypothetical protein
MHEIGSPEEARQMVDFWARAGMDSFKAYMHLPGPSSRRASPRRTD